MMKQSPDQVLTRAMIKPGVTSPDGGAAALVLNAIYILCDNEKIYSIDPLLAGEFVEIATVNTSAIATDDIIVGPNAAFVYWIRPGLDLRYYNGSAWSTVDGVSRSIGIDPVDEIIFVSDNNEIRTRNYDGTSNGVWRSAGSLATGIAVDPVARRVYWIEYINDDYVRINLDKSGFVQTSLGFEFGDFNQTGRADPEHGFIYFTEENTSGADHLYRLTIEDNSFEELLPGNYSIANQAFAPLRVTNEMAVAQVGTENVLRIIDNSTLLEARSKTAPAAIVAIFCDFTEAPV